MFDRRQDRRTKGSRSHADHVEHRSIPAEVMRMENHWRAAGPVVHNEPCERDTAFRDHHLQNLAMRRLPPEAATKIGPVGYAKSYRSRVRVTVTVTADGQPDGTVRRDDDALDLELDDNRRSSDVQVLLGRGLSLALLLVPLRHRHRLEVEQSRCSLRKTGRATIRGPILCRKRSADLIATGECL